MRGFLAKSDWKEVEGEKEIKYSGRMGVGGGQFPENGQQTASPNDSQRQSGLPSFSATNPAGSLEQAT